MEVFVKSKGVVHTILIDRDDALQYPKLMMLHKKGVPYVYLRIAGSRKTHPLARMLCKCDSNQVVDHINQNPLDNRRCNLRAASRRTNCFNSKLFCTNTSGLRGVTKRKECNRYQASTTIDNKTVYLGLFKTAAEVHAAYLAARPDL